MQKLNLEEYDFIPRADFNSFNIMDISISLTQHLGEPSIPLIKEGDTVYKGQLIATIPDNAIGSNIHSSINGTVYQIADGEIKIHKTK